MTPQSRTLSAAGVSTWIKLDTGSPWFGVALGVKLTSGANLTYKVQHTLDDIFKFTDQWVGTRSGTTLTIVKAAHGLSAGDWVLIQGVGAPWEGDQAVAGITDANTFTITVANSGPTAHVPGARLATARVFDHSTLTALTASGQGNYVLPPVATRLNITSYTGGSAELLVIQQGA